MSSIISSQETHSLDQVENTALTPGYCLNPEVCVLGCVPTVTLGYKVLSPSASSVGLQIISPFSEGVRLVKCRKICIFIGHTEVHCADPL